PLATYAGWNLRATETGGTSELAGLLGSCIPFPRTRAERERNGDPRLSIQERYDSPEDYLGRYADAALKLVDEGLLLAEDLPFILKQGRERWAWATSRYDP
ncbi:MAG: alpha/beta hydrolase domain-containing protein, partial [Bacillota bacterium]|nr:alpha/beta hydrolase domain-containing protein [Bacillota bacterium]